MKLAILPGFNLLVPQGKLVGGTLQENAAVQPPGRDRLRDQLDQLPREERAARRARSSAIADQPGMTVGCVNPGAARRARLGAARQLLVRAVEPARRRAARSVVERRRAADALSCAPKGLVSASCVNDGPRGYLSIRTNAQSERQAHRPHRRRGRRVRHVPARLGHAPGRRARSAGRPHPRSRRDQRSIQNSCSTLSSSASASLIASVADGVNTPFSTVFTVLRVTPTRSASSAWVRPSSLRRPSAGWRAAQASLSARRSRKPKRSSAAAMPNDMMRCSASRAGHRLIEGHQIEQHAACHAHQEREAERLIAMSARRFVIGEIAHARG